MVQISEELVMLWTGVTLLLAAGWALAILGWVKEDNPFIPLLGGFVALCTVIGLAFTVSSFVSALAATQ